MRSQIKTDFEKWLIANVLTAEGSNYFIQIGSYKVYFFFEGEKYTTSPNFISMQIQAEDKKRLATNTKYHSGFYRFYIYTENILAGDKIVDALSAILDEITIEQSLGFRIETDLLTTKYRGQKIAESTHYETIADLIYSNWEC